MVDSLQDVRPHKMRIETEGLLTVVAIVVVELGVVPPGHLPKKSRFSQRNRLMRFPLPLLLRG